MFYSGKEKLFDDDGNAPQGIKDQFKGTFIDTFPGTDTVWVILGLLEFGVFLLLLASLVFLEFLPHRPKLFLQLGLAVSLLTFACLAFGQTATKQFAGTASLYTYFGMPRALRHLYRGASVGSTVRGVGEDPIAFLERAAASLRERKAIRRAERD